MERFDVDTTDPVDPTARVTDAAPSNGDHRSRIRSGGSYVDFEIEIGPGQGRTYPVAVIRSPAGEARSTMRFPYDEIALDNRLKDLQVALLRSGG
ncbi:MAG: hypothetical protein OER95_08795, partial [Acidimicrobiia bacterium]|nr:hypothetical protein [Acidimicrobiia bacterium]